MNDASRELNRASWAAQALALFIPFTAILHNAVFYRGTCILNLISDERNEYSWGALLRLFQKDPSIWIGVGLAVGVFFAGLAIRHPLARAWVPIFLVAFIPISLWVWDIPGAGQPICRCCHDLRFALPLVGPVRSRTVYALCLALFATISAVRVWINRTRANTATHATNVA